MSEERTNWTASHWQTAKQTAFSGVTLRDYFATAALPVVEDAAVNRRETLTLAETAARCYQIADAMLDARGRS